MAVRLGTHLMSLHDQLLYEPLSHRVRCFLEGIPVCDTTSPVLVWETRRVVPMYAVPEDDVLAELVPATPTPIPAGLPPVLGPVHFELHLDPGDPLDVRAGDRVVAQAAFRPADPDLAGHVVLEWAPFDWREEEQPALGHPHDVFKRIDVLPTSRHLVVSLDGEVLAETTRALLLQETLLPPRWYVPPEDVRMDHLVPSPARTVCAYKGHATYWSLADDRPGGRDLAWTYRAPLHDAAAVKDHVAFYNERVDLTVDGELLPRPRTPWSSPAEQELY